MKIPAGGDQRSLDDVLASELQLRFLAALSQATQALTDAAAIMEVTARMLGQHLRANRCAYAEVDADQDGFRILGDYNDGVASIVGRFAFSDFGQAVLTLMRTNEPYVVDDVDTDPRTAAMDKAAYRATSIQAVICIPLHKDQRFVAAMAVHQSTSRHWDPEEIELVRLVVARCWESLERSRSERNLLVANAQLNLALEAASLGDWAWSAESDAVTMPPRTQRLLGLPTSGGIHWTQLKKSISAEDLPAVDAEVERSRVSGTRFTAEYRLALPGRPEIWVASWGFPQYSAAGEFLGLSGLVQDVTARRRLEKELQEKAAALVEADRRKDEFLATLAHELRNPLAPIRMAAEVLSHPATSAQQLAKSVDVVRRQVSHMSRLLDDLLDVARITRGQLRLKKERVSLQAIVDSAAETALPFITAKNHRLVIDVDSPNEGIHADPVRIVQVLTNLLTNAAKYTDPGGTITVTANAGNGVRRISVADTGIGVPPEALQSVFDMFSQDKSVLERSEGGLGIGLALAKGLVELHGGTIEAFSEGAGRGTEFLVTLPSPPAEVGRSSGSGARQAGAGTARLVLVADDNVDGAESLAELLRLHGNIVEVALDGEAALQQARLAPPDVMILDIGMPGLNGYQVAQAVRREAWGGAVRLVAVTGWGQNSDRALAYEAGFDEHLTKPCDPRRLLEIVSS